MIVGVCGFSWSGSGAVLDYLMEFSENQVYTPEFIIAYHPDGLHDLDLNLNYNCAKFLSSGVAIPRFRKLANCLLKGETHGKSKRLTDDYLNKITQAQWIGSEQGQMLVGNTWIYRNIGERIKQRIIIGKLPQEFCWKYKPYPLGKMNFSICPDGFDEITKEYTDYILESIGLNTSKSIVLNQPFPGNNPVPYMKYFRNSKAIVVDRDPRDVFTFLKYVFPGRGYSVPLENVRVFCKYYHNMHKKNNTSLNHPDVLYIKFEDLVYYYDKTTLSIRDFLNLSQESTSMKYFIPEESEANTQVFREYGDPQEIEIIEEELAEYLYDFSSVEKRSTNVELFDDNPKSERYSFRRQ